ncbi:uncharacterized protein LOC124127893 isoform X2 [Haliotis rufescens]|uniref:uncharacterized protein LOC124127893 isoform X2 n=1 Tax=Haliotis rufescens TaxID=6454 RepID=UPI00201FAF58|nr:uncharacterized protein LOC124127893 isoform X2 [Haliotis rufescens]
MKTWWNILIWIWIGVIQGEEHVNGDFSLTSSPLTPTDGELFTLTCRIPDESAANIGWLQNNKDKVVTQNANNCMKQALAYGQDFINRINVSCSTTAHSITFRFNSTTDQGSAWQCGKPVNDTKIHPRSNNYTIGEFVLTSTPLTATDGELFTLICHIPDESAINIGWLQNNKTMVVTQQTPNCNKQALAYGDDIINRINVSCSSTTHSMTFRFNSTTDQGSAWQCGELVNDTKIYPRSNIYTIDVASPVMSSQSLSTTTRYMETTSDSETESPNKGPLNQQPLNVECYTLAVIAGSTIGTLLLTLLIGGLVLTVLYRKGFRFGNILKGTASRTSTRNPEVEEMKNKGYSSLDHISGRAQNSGVEKEGSDKQHYTQLKIYQNTNVEAKAETSTYEDVTEPPPLSYESINASPYQNARAQH